MDTTDKTETTDRTQSGVGRRTVLKSTAWSVPAIAVVAATPAYASSSGTTTVPLITGGTLKGTRGTNNSKKDVVFTWSFSVAAGQTITAEAVSMNQPTDITFASATVTGTYNVAFTGRTGANTTAVPGFTITVSFTHNGTPKSATFSVTGASVAENTTHTFTVTPGTSNPTV